MAMNSHVSVAIFRKQPNILGRGFVAAWFTFTRKMPVLVEELTRLEGHKWQISCLDFSPDGSRLATGSWDKEVRIWNLGSLDTTVTLSKLHKVPVTSLAWFKPEGTLLATGSADTTIGLWNTVTGEKLSVLKDCFGWVLGTSFSADGNFLGAASWDKMVWLWEPNTGTLINQLRGHKAGVWSLDFHSERSVVCSGSADGTIRLWDARSNKCAALLGEEDQDNSVHSVKWSPDNTTIAAASADAKVWDNFVDNLFSDTIFLYAGYNMGCTQERDC